MAKIVLAGRSDCPFFARCELLADRLAKNLQEFKLHKIVLQPDQWENWLNKTCSERGWSFRKSPIVWRELTDRGGKGVLIGGANDFQEYAKAYYDVESDMKTYDMEMVSKENKITKDIVDEEERTFRALSRPVNICITNAASSICYYLVNFLSSGQVFGAGIELTISLLVSSAADVEQVKGTAMEAEDLASGLLRSIKVTTSPHEAFEDCSFVITLDSFNRSNGETEKEWLERNEAFFSKYGVILNDKALKTCKVLLCGSGPLNYNATVLVENAPHLLHQNIVAVSSVVENQAKSLVGEKLNVNQAGVVNLIVWGNINGVRYLDVSNCQIHGYDGAVKGPSWYSVSGIDTLHDNRWTERELPKLLASRFQKVSKTRGYLTGLSTASAIAGTLQNWCRGSPPNQMFSLGVYSQGWYSVPVGMFFSFPVTMDPKGGWSVVEDLDITKETKEGIQGAIMDIQYQQSLTDYKTRESFLSWGRISGSSDFLTSLVNTPATVQHSFDRLSFDRAYERRVSKFPDEINDIREESSVISDQLDQHVQLQDFVPSKDDTTAFQDVPSVHDSVPVDDNVLIVHDQVPQDDNVSPVEDNLVTDENIQPVDDNLEQNDNIPLVTDNLEQDNIPPVDDNLKLDGDVSAVDDNLEQDDNITRVNDNLAEDDNVPPLDNNLSEEFIVPPMDDNLAQDDNIPPVGDNNAQDDIFPSIDDSFPQNDIIPSVDDNLGQDDTVPSIDDSFPQDDIIPSVDDNLPPKSDTSLQNILQEDKTPSVE